MDDVGRLRKRSIISTRLVGRVIAVAASAMFLMLGTPPQHDVSVVRTAQEVVPGSQSQGYICRPRTMPQADCDAAVFVLEFALTHNWAAPQGYKGNKRFQNNPPLLPLGGDYLEYDIYPAPPPGSGGRDAKRLVVDKGTQIAFYTSDHYLTADRFSYS